jgi:hypothetical protein
MAPDPADTPVPGLPPEEAEQPSPEDGHVIARRRPDGPRIDDAGDPVPLDRHPHHGN